MLLSNIVEDGKPIGLADAGQDWHTDMSYNPVVGFTNVLYGVKMPRRDGKPLGNTVFADMHAAYDELSPALKSEARQRHRDARLQQVLGGDAPPSRLAAPGADGGAARRAPALGASGVPHPSDHRAQGALRQSRLHRAHQRTRRSGKRRRARPNSSATSFSRNISTRTVWTEGDVLMWDHIGTLHNAIPDYRPDEPRLIKRCQVMADRIFDPAFVREHLAQAAV